MPRNDFNGDGRSDILWLLNGNQAVTDWLGTTSGGFAVNDVNAYRALNAFHQFDFAATGDFNGDGRSDLLWLVDGSDYEVAVSRADGSHDPFGSNPFFQKPGGGWSIAGTGDFNGDGVDDLLWRNGDGTLSNWLGTKSGAFVVNDANALARVSSDWHVVGTGDFNGDGRSDILWQSDAGYISNWLGKENGGYLVNDASALTRFRVPIVTIGDFNGDNRDDFIAVDDWSFYDYFPSRSNGGFDTSNYQVVADAVTGWSIQTSGDFNGDGTDDLLWRNADGRLSDWLGIKDGGGTFNINDANALSYVAPGWQVADLWGN